MRQKALVCWEWIKDHTVEIISFVIITIFIALMAFFIQAALTNAGNEISEGIIVDKYYKEAYTLTTIRSVSENVTMPVTEYHPAVYRFKIQGDKDGKTVEYSFSVTETEYNAYKIGDYYTR